MSAEPPQNRPLCVAVGMSGGTDSSAAAALLLEQGHQVVGLTAHLWQDGSRCCSLEDARRAERVCKKLGVPHHLVDARGFFSERIVSPFVRAYAEGRTPSPCVVCNQVIKFGLLLREAMTLGCTHLATGHYARLVRRDDGLHLLRGADTAKDQSYFLHRLSTAQLEHVLFPLGEKTKADAHHVLQRLHLPVPPSGESQDLCFVTDDGYAAFLEKRRPELRQPGPIVNRQGRLLGRHAGLHRYTIGQREGLGIASDTRMYVKELRAESNTLVVGQLAEVLSDHCRLDDVHWIHGAPEASITCSVRLRYRHAGAPAVVTPRTGPQATVKFNEPQFAVTPGQAAVFYLEDEVLGGGWIAAPAKEDG